MADTISLIGKKISYQRNGKQIGFLKFKFPDDPSKKTNRNIEIDWIAVNQKFRRQGIATKLVEYFLKTFNDRLWVTFWTGRQIELDNAWKLYEKVGFKQVYYQEDYFEKGVGTRLFVKRLK